jgi:hypothetical protein
VFLAGPGLQEMSKRGKKDEEEEEEHKEDEEEEEEEEVGPLEPKVFGRSNRGNKIEVLGVFLCVFFFFLFSGRMIQKMIATQPAADEFWDEKAQKFFAEEEGDDGFDVALDPDAKYVDKVDSDFDEDESSAESEEVEEEKAEKKKQLYQDPRNNKKVVSGKKKSVAFAEPAVATAPAIETTPVVKVVFFIFLFFIIFYGTQKGQTGVYKEEGCRI